MAKVNQPIKEFWGKHKKISPLKLSRNNVVSVVPIFDRKKRKKAK